MMRWRKGGRQSKMGLMVRYVVFGGGVRVERTMEEEEQSS